MNKAGSTTIQQALNDMRHPSVAFARMEGHDHNDVFTIAYCGKLRRDLRQTTEAARADARDTIRAAYDATAKDLIVSSENLSAFRQPEAIAALVDDARTSFDRVRVLAYLREPIAYMTSAIQQNAKVNDLPDAPFAQVWPRYEPRFAPWIDVLGAENVVLRAFDPATFAGGDLVADFAHRVGLPPEALSSVRPRNVSLSAEAVGVLLAYHRGHGPSERGPLVGRLVELLHGFGSTRLAFARETLDPIVARRAADVAWAEARMGQPFPPPPSPPADAPAFPDVAALRRHGEGLAGELSAWQRAVAPRARPQGGSVADILHAVWSDLANPGLAARILRSARFRLGLR